MEDINDIMEGVDEPATLIQPNPVSLSVDERSSRFRGAEWYGAIRGIPVTLAGIGGIGSHTAFLLSRVGVCDLILYDGDRVEESNLSGQLYGVGECGMYKVNAISSILSRMSSFHRVAAHEVPFTEGGSSTTRVAICGFDNMEARKAFYRKWKYLVESRDDKERCLFIDGRLAAEDFQILCMTGNDVLSMQRYEDEYLFPSSEADSVVCSYKQTTHIASMIASVIVNLFTNFVVNSLKPPIERALPFLTEYRADCMYFKTEY